MKKTIYILISSVFIIILLSFTDVVLQFNYVLRTVFKIVIFLGLPFIYIRWSKIDILKTSIKNYKETQVLGNILLGILVMFVIFISYYFLGKFLDIEKISSDVSEKYKISKTAYILVSAYISFGNSFLEELFFRGFIFLNIKQLGYKRLAYASSALLFSLYHLPNIYSWFSWWVLILACIGLFVGGLIFAYLDDEKDSFLNSYIIHICADIPIVLIGYIMMY